ncbi:MAG: electron transfer flavoprotein subunit beta/FixA family protein [Clostridiaceae bacterium]|nr:electron transfer flavoprotein subunit beta/FixA family protein [Clostridiaceae bacterium]
MRIIVCVKQVPSEGRVRVDPQTGTLVRDGRFSVINPFDLAALETAVQLKERFGGCISVLSMGIPATAELLRDLIARGADDAVLLTDRLFAGADTLATSYTLSLGIQSLGGADLILCGRMAVDGDTAQIGPELAETLDLPHVCNVAEVLETSEQAITVRALEDGGSVVLRMALPGVVTLAREAAQPRFPSIAGLRRGWNAEIQRLDAAALCADSARTGRAGSPTRVVRTFTPEHAAAEPPAVLSPEEAALRILNLWKEAGGND